jgi:hypothetical protein
LSGAFLNSGLFSLVADDVHVLLLRVAVQGVLHVEPVALNLLDQVAAHQEADPTDHRVAHLVGEEMRHCAHVGRVGQLEAQPQVHVAQQVVLLLDLEGRRGPKLRHVLWVELLQLELEIGAPRVPHVLEVARGVVDEQGILAGNVQVLRRHGGLPTSAAQESFSARRIPRSRYVVHVVFGGCPRAARHRASCLRGGTA